MRGKRNIFGWFTLWLGALAVALLSIDVDSQQQSSLPDMVAASSIVDSVEERIQFVEEYSSHAELTPQTGSIVVPANSRTALQRQRTNFLHTTPLFTGGSALGKNFEHNLRSVKPLGLITPRAVDYFIITLRRIII